MGDLNDFFTLREVRDIGFRWESLFLDRDIAFERELFFC